ncbi:patched domain-containing protein 1 [Festucalex cinctus]
MQPRAGWERLERVAEARGATLRRALRGGLGAGFGALGRLVAGQPALLASAPALLAVLLGASFSRYRVEEDVRGLLAPKHSLARMEGKLVGSLFPINHSKHALYSDLQMPAHYGRVIVVARRGSLLETPNLDAVLELHRLISQMQVTVPAASGPGGFNYSFSHLCLPDDKNACLVDDIIRALEATRSARAANGSAPTLHYPITRLADGRRAYVGHQLGGVQTGEGEAVRSARALQLTYYLRARGGGPTEGAAARWEGAFGDRLRRFAARHPRLALYPVTSASLAGDFQLSSALARRPLLVGSALCSALAVLCCCMRDCVRAKPWLGLLALLSTALAGLTAAGILNLSGAAYNSTYLGIPFVMLGQGLSGSLEMLSSWRRTREDQHVKERVAGVFSEVMPRLSGSAALHLLTLGLAASPLTNLEALRLFCRAAALGVAVGYAYTLSFFGSCLVLSGYLETGYRHACFCRRVPKRERLDSEPAWYRCLMYTRYQDEAAPQQAAADEAAPARPGGDSDARPRDSHLLLGCVRRCYGDWITNTYVKPFVVLLYLVYVSFALMGFLQVSQGSDPSALVATDTATARNAAAQRRYFSSYSPVIGFYIYESAPYWNASVQRHLLDYAGGFRRISWLESYLAYLAERNQSSSGFSRRNFTLALRHDFLRQPQFAHFADDIIFSGGEEPDVAASRIFLAAKTAGGGDNRREMSALLSTLRRLSLTSRVRFLVFNPSFVYLDRYGAAVCSPPRRSLLAALFLLGVSSLAPLEPLAAAWLALTLLSVQFGVLGFMTLWGVELDGVSAACLIAALGHTADCSGPLLCGFVAGGGGRTRRVRLALERHGVPVLQALLCYGAALAPVGFVRSGLTRTLFRCLALTAGCSALHALAFLPALLTFLPPAKSRDGGDDAPRREVECVEMDGGGGRVVDQITTV